MIKLTENWTIDTDTYNVVLECRESRIKVGKNGESKEVESVETYYYPNLKNALKAYLHKSLKSCTSIDEVLRRIDEVEAKIDALNLQKQQA